MLKRLIELAEIPTFSKSFNFDERCDYAFFNVRPPENNFVRKKFFAEIIFGRKNFRTKNPFGRFGFGTKLGGAKTNWTK